MSSCWTYLRLTRKLLDSAVLFGSQCKLLLADFLIEAVLMETVLVESMGARNGG